MGVFDLVYISPKKVILTFCYFYNKNKEIASPV